MRATVTGVDRAIRKLQQLGERAERMAKAVVQSNADLIVNDAKQRAPANLGKLRQSIGKVVTNDGLSALIFVGESYGAYVEFGTGTHVSVPTELQEEAIKFKGGTGSGNFQAFLTAIEDWCRNKGIDPKLAYVICVSILRKGLQPRPYLYPAYVGGKAKLIRDLKTAINQIQQQNRTI